MAAEVNEAQPIIEGSPEFIKRISGTSNEVVKEEVAAGPIEIPVTVDKHGNVVNPEGVPAEILAQFDAPGVRERIAELYRKNRYEKPEMPEPRYLQGDILGRRSFINECPIGMATRDFRRARRKVFRKMTKNALRHQANQRSNHVRSDNAKSDQHP